MKTNQSFWRHSRIILVLIAIVLITGIMGCATFGPKYASTKKDIGPVSKEKGRIVFYRPSGFYGGGMRPDILINGSKVGISRPGTIFYVDVNPGKYQVAIPAILYPGETIVNITISKNEIVYIKNYMGGSAFGGRTNFEVVNTDQAMTEIDELEFMIEPIK